MNKPVISDYVEQLRGEIDGMRCVARLTDDLMTRDTFNNGADRLEIIASQLSEDSRLRNACEFALSDMVNGKMRHAGVCAIKAALGDKNDHD